ncbi:hypothetical protein [Parvibaculum sp. MBR-TMA-1.3b-4.2]|jgi:hypothetical protein
MTVLNAGRVASEAWLCLLAIFCISVGSSEVAAKQPASPEELKAIREAVMNHDCTTGQFDMAQYNGMDLFRALAEIPVDEARTMFADKTQVSSDTHGTQIEYTSADGEAHLWYPGNSRVLHGRWKIEQEGGFTKVCFAYEGASVNPLTGHTGSGFECGAVQSASMSTVDSVEGDVFQLARTDEVKRPLAKDAVSAYVPNCRPVKRPYLTNGKTPIEHLLEAYPPQPTR